MLMCSLGNFFHLFLQKLLAYYNLKKFTKITTSREKKAHILHTQTSVILITF